MLSIPVFHCPINTDDTTLIGNFLRKEGFLQQNSSSTFIKSNFDHKIQVDLSQSLQSPFIICCCSAIPKTLPQLLSILHPKSSRPSNLILSVQPTDSIEWNPLISRIAASNIVLNIVNNENDFCQRLCDIIHQLAKQNLRKEPTSINLSKHGTIAEIQVDY